MKPTHEWADASQHPIAWFSALLRGIHRGDRDLIDRALHELAALGFAVRLGPGLVAAPDTSRQAAGQDGGR